MPSPRLALTVLALILISPLLATAQTKEDTITYAIQSDLPNWDPPNSVLRESIILGYHVFDHLAARDLKTGKVELSADPGVVGGEIEPAPVAWHLSGQRFLVVEQERLVRGVEVDPAHALRGLAREGLHEAHAIADGAHHAVVLLGQR